MSPLLRFLTTGAIALIGWLAWDFFYVRFGFTANDSNSLLSSAFLLAVYSGFLWAAFPLFSQQTVAWRFTGRIVVSMLSTTVWLALALLAVLQFHLAIGGRL